MHTALLPPYWLELSTKTLLGTVVLSKLYFLIHLFTWGVLPQVFYDLLQYISHWPNLLTGTFPWLYDDRGTRGVSFSLGMPDVTSVAVNFFGYLVVALAMDYLFRRVNNGLRT